MNPISGGQIRMIYGLARRCGMDGDELHGMIAAQTGRESIRELTIYQGVQLIDRLKGMAGERTTREAAGRLAPEIAKGDEARSHDAAYAVPWPSEDIPGRASAGQRRMIRSVIREMGWTDERLRAFLDKRYHVSDVAFLPSAKCGAVIEALKAMRDGGRGDRRERHG